MDLCVKKKRFELTNGHSIIVEKVNRDSLKNDYKITFFEDGRKLDEEYGNRDYIEYQYGVKLNKLLSYRGSYSGKKKVVKTQNSEIGYKEIIKLFNSLTGSRSLWQVYQDCIEMVALSIQNSCELYDTRRQNNEKRYLNIVNTYNKKEVEIMVQIYAKFIEMLEENPFQDLLGDLYMRLDLGSKSIGQFFTPYNVAKMMASIAYDAESIKEKIKEKGFITLSEPCIGGGANVIAFCEILHEANINYQKHLIIVGQDLSRIVALQAYIALSLIGCRAVIKVGSTLTEPYTNFYKEIKNNSELWYTPFFILGGNYI